LHVVQSDNLLSESLRSVVVLQDSHNDQKVYVGAIVPADQRRQLVELARREDRSVSAVLRRALAAELDRQEVRRSS